VIVPPPKTAEALARRAGEGFKTVDWYYSTRPL
jgi:peroxiredoxin (alkyl hydroperoxide reductase subunit C)